MVHDELDVLESATFGASHVMGLIKSWHGRAMRAEALLPTSPSGCAWVAWPFEPHLTGAPARRSSRVGAYAVP